MIVSTLTTQNPEALESDFRKILIHLDAAQVESLFVSLAAIEFTHIQEPQTGLIMLTATDAFGEPFHLGEVLASTAEVEFEGLRGHATVMGDDGRRAVLAAAVSAISRHDDASRLLSPFQEALSAMAGAIEATQRQEAAMIAATRVKFDSMAPETM